MKHAITGALLAVLAAAGCTSHHEAGTTDTFVGAACTSDTDCADRCYTDPGGGDLPGGFCSLPCTSDADCPADSACVDRAGGMCMFVCPPFDCTFLGPGWGCHDADHVGGGSINVCRG